jgi:purine-nucleoside phosphorylase
MGYLFEQALEAASSVKNIAGEPRIGIILGSGLGRFARSLPKPEVVPYTRIHNFPPARVEGHAGQLVFATIDGVRIAVLSGRVHYYEGHSLDSVTLPTRTLALLGIQVLVVTNAAGGIREDLHPGDLMAVTDHVNLMGVNPLQGPWDPRFGPRYPDMSAAYDPRVRAALHDAAEASGATLKDGVYAAVPGPSYETPAEIRMLRNLGADAVGMSTVPEVIVANQMGLKVAALSCISNKAAGISRHRLSHQEVMEETARASEHFIKVLRAAIPRLAAVVAKVTKKKAEQPATLREQRSVGIALKKAKVGKRKSKVGAKKAKVGAKKPSR